MAAVPTVAHSFGAPRRGPSGRDLGGFYTASYVVFRLADRADTDIRAAVEEANAWVGERSSSIAGFRKTGGSLEYYITVSTDDRVAAELGHEVLAQVVEFGASISLEILGMTNQ